MDTLEIKGDWHIFKGKVEEMLGRIQKRTGQSREVVEKAIHDSSSHSCC